MKKTLVALAAFASVSAFAQSAVTISGTVNYGVKNLTTTPVGLDTATYANQPLSSNQQWGGLKGDRNRLSFDVTEDLGGGMSTIAKLETRFQLQSGQAGYANGAAATSGASGTTLFEQTMVGIKSNDLGTVKFGRFTNVLGTYDYSVFEDSAFGTNAANASYGRHNAQMQYESPSMSGFTVGAVGANAMYNKYGQTTQGYGFVGAIDYARYSASGLSNMGAGVITYANGPIVAQFAKIQGFFNDKATRVGVNYTLASGTRVYAGAYNQQGNVGEVNTSVSGAQKTAASDAGGGLATGLQAHSATELGLMVPAGQFNLRAGWVRNSKDLAIGVSDGSTKAEKISFGAEYSISKRTMVIAQKGSVKNGLNVANQSAQGSGFTQGSMSFLGLQHSF